ncbi:hypothetical protein F66182_6395 [Fusarium sp. NRRL 66182]|nr:hypothetical protein F66182_6395 [Fusarium sp. NRRL 66182]
MASQDGDASTRQVSQVTVSEAIHEDIRASSNHQLHQDQTEETPSAPVQDPVSASATDHDEPEYIDTDDEGDLYRLNVGHPKPQKMTEKKLRDHAVLQAFIEKSQREAAKSAIVTINDPEKQSLAQIIHMSENRKIIATPREYQIELFERAKEKNTIVVLPTGSGKTLISALLVRHYLEQEVEARALGRSKKVAFFLVEKVALCVQQHAVLDCNLGQYPVTKFTGNTTGLAKTEQYWNAQFSENMAVVCTAQILLDCLNNGFIGMSQINLLIFDEAHHAKKGHPYARIMKHHYFRHQGDRPRILGMTASPVDSHTKDVKATTLELEHALDSEIATISEDVLMESMARQRQIEEVAHYNALEIPDDAVTSLWAKILEQVSRNEQFKASLDFTKEASSSLGPWCADQYWRLLITDHEIARLAARSDREFAQDFAVTRSDQAAEAIRRVQQIVNTHHFGTINPSSEKLSSKVKKLHEILHHAFTVDNTKRCIVFVEKRYTACLLSDLYHNTSMKIQGMFTSYMVGCQSTNANLGNMSFRDQVVTLQKFKRGEVNCLFATGVAEEGIDVPDCDLVIRFDLYHSVIQYLQSRGRARQAHSRYITMLEENNRGQLRSLRQAEKNATALQKFCISLPLDRKLQDESIDPVNEMQNELVLGNVHEIPSTGARLTFPSSLELLARFVCSGSSEDRGRLEYQIRKNESGKFVADAILPLSFPINFMSGFPQRSRLLAKCSAAFETCKALIRRKYIDGHLQSTLKKKAHVMRNARLGISPNKKADYDMRLRPNIWDIRGDCAQLFITTITLDSAIAPGEGRPSKSLILLSRKPLPKLPGVPLFFGNGRSSVAQLTSAMRPLELSNDEIEGLAQFTLRIFADVFSKEYDATYDQLPYLLAPCTESSKLAGTKSGIDWDAVDLVKNNETLDWENQPKEFFEKKLVTDPYDGGRKLVIKGIDESKKPSDPTPEGVPESRSRAYRFVEPTIKEYSNSLYSKSRSKAQWREDQPVVKAQLLSLRRNMLDEFQVDEEANKDCFVILEPLHVSPLPIDAVLTAMAFPAIIHRIDSALIALDACALLDLSIAPTLALEAMTKDSDNSGDHGKAQINFQPGMGDNYERLEFLGDSFLKMATTISIFTLMPNGDEGIYHVERMVLICNQNLFNHAVDRNLQDYIRSKAFDRRTWYPDLPLKKGKAPKTAMRHNLADKTIADVCEALIGAAYLSSRDDNMNMAVKAVTQMVNRSYHTMNTFDEYFASYKVPAWQKAEGNAKQRVLVQKVADATGYVFKSPPLVHSAFKHPSWPYDAVPHYQRLEFLGDALLDMAIIDHLYRRFPLADPQWLTEHKIAMVSNQFLACLCVKLDLHKHLLFTTSSLIGHIHNFVTEVNLAEEDARKEAEAEGVPMRMDFWIKVTEPPKACADSVEALVGAMFVDSQYNYSVVERFFARFIEPYFVDMSLYDSFANKHPATFLSKKMQKELGCANWRISAEAVPCGVEEGLAVLKESDVVAVFMVHQQVIADATCKSGRYAKIAVAKRGLEMINSFGNDFAAAKKALGCDCKFGMEEVEEVDHGTAI